MDSIKKVISTELKNFESKFADAMKSDTPLVDSIMKYIIKRKGKQIRPMFVFLSAKLHGAVNESTYRAAALVELLHTATLVHDDVVDESTERRGFLSINAIWKNKIAVLVGDYLLSRGLLLSTSHSDYEQLHILSEAVREMSEGELLQIEKTRKLNLKEDVYFEIVRKKTASLLSSACAIGTFSSTQNKELAAQMKLFGEKTGIAFQIKDDLLDFGSDNIGKPKANDIKEKKMTLPLIYTLNEVEKSTKRKLIYIIKNENKNPDSVKFVIDEVTKCGGLIYANEKMIEHKNAALQLLRQFPSNEVRNALEELVEYTTERKY
jgi:octaprenyl-diphosphate synthase